MQSVPAESITRRIVRVYIAAPFELIHDARALRDQLHQKGFYVTSRWLDESANETFQKMEGEERKRFCADRDVEDIDNSDAFLLINPDTWAQIGTGGRHTEVGIALKSGLPIFIYGTRTNVFHSLREINYVSNDPVEVIGAMRFTFGIDS